MSEENQEHVTGKWGKSEPCYIVAENLAKFCPMAIWKAELKSNEIGY